MFLEFYHFSLYFTQLAEDVGTLQIVIFPCIASFLNLFTLSIDKRFKSYPNKFILSIISPGTVIISQSKFAARVIVYNSLHPAHSICIFFKFLNKCFEYNINGDGSNPESDIGPAKIETIALTFVSFKNSYASFICSYVYIAVIFIGI